MACAKYGVNRNTVTPLLKEDIRLLMIENQSHDPNKVRVNAVTIIEIVKY